MTDFEKAFIEALEEGHAYDFIANHYTQLSKESLKDIILECLYEIEQSAGCDRYADTDNIVEELNDRWDYEDEPTAPFMGENMYIGGNIDEL